MNINKNRIIEALNSPRWKEVKEPYTAIDMLVRRAYANSGTAVANEAISYTTSTLMTWILREYPNITTEETAYAVELGGNGALDKSNFVSLNNLEAWIRTYATSQERNIAIGEFKKSKNKAPQIDDKTLKERHRNYYRALFHHVQETGTIWNTGRYPYGWDGLYVYGAGENVYNELDAKGIWKNVTKEEVLESERRATIQERERVMVLGQAAIEGDPNGKHIALRKCALVEMLFQKMIAQGRDIEELLTSIGI